MLAMGLLVIAHGLFTKHMRVRGNNFRGEILRKRWQVLLKRAWLVLIGLMFCIFAFTFDARR